MFREKFYIGKKIVSNNVSPIIIAEGGLSHFGCFKKMKKLIDLAKKAGADIFKTQFYITSQLISSLNQEWCNRMVSKEVDINFIKEAKEYAEKKGLLFLCTPHDEQSFHKLKNLNLLAYKIGSGEKGNFKFLEMICKENKPLIISTGMHSMSEINNLLIFLKKQKIDKVALLHCVSSYPTPLNDLNLINIKNMMDKYNLPIGYSDHSDSFLPSYVAASMGVCIIEKHITLDYDIPDAQDWRVSAGPDDFVDFVKNVKNVRCVIGKQPKKIRVSELKASKWALKRVVSSKDLKKNQIINQSDILLKRSEKGIEAKDFFKIIGKRIKKSVRKDFPVLKSYF